MTGRREEGVPHHRVVDLAVAVLGLPAAVEEIAGWAGEGRGRMVCLANVHMVMEAHDDPAFRQVVAGADRVLADGRPLYWLQRRHHPAAGQVRGEDLTLALCRRAAEVGIPVGFHGGRPEVLERLVAEMKGRFPGLQVVWHHSPPFRSLTIEEEREELEAIRAAAPALLFVGLGCPRQERWMAERRAQLPCVMLGVGAAFDFIAGSRREAPRWLQRLGLEWLLRLLDEPRRLWRRYLLHNPRFLWLALRQTMRGD
ncbi:MAG TPA: WecB/TagA/CpsF family glycosyltransferase [Thiotrichales bacterium]|nr:WecB/TagA/CpsF family glycosyltransferase [Thiotrichales bacterium]